MNVQVGWFDKWYRVSTKNTMNNTYEPVAPEGSEVRDYKGGAPVTPEEAEKFIAEIGGTVL